MIFTKISKTIFGNGKKYFIFVFLSVFFSLYSYTLGNNIVLSVDDYLKDQIKPMVGGDVAISTRDETADAKNLDKYLDIFEMSKTISFASTIFDQDKNPALYNLVYKSDNYPFYNTFTYTTINKSGTIIIDQKTFDKYGKTIEILGKSYVVKGIINSSPLGDISMYSPVNNIYLPIS